MKMFQRFKRIIGLSVACVFILSACNWGGKPNKMPEEEVSETVEPSTFSLRVQNEGNVIQGGVLKVALVSDTPFEGILNAAFLQGMPDAQVLSYFDESLLSMDENYIYDQDGAATYVLSEDKRTITLKIKENVKWHDGMKVTASDLEFAYLVIGSPDYMGVRYDAQMNLIEGMSEYHEGKTNQISGIKVIDEQTISITMKTPNPSMLTGLWTTPLHKEYLKDIPIAKLAEDPKIRVNPIGFGPFKVKKIIPGEAVEYEAFKEYHLGAPKLEGVLLKVVNPQLVNASLEKGEVDVAQISADNYDKAKTLTNISLLGQLELAYTYIGFKLGKYDPQLRKTMMDNAKMSDKRLRQAVGYALDNESAAEQFYKGLRTRANSVIPPSQKKYHEEELKGYPYDPQKAKALLDEAGYMDVNGDGYREDPDGNEFILHFASMSGGEIAEPLTLYYIQLWQEVGLNVKLVNDRLIEFNSFYEMVQNDDPKVDMYMAAWSTGSDPDPSGIWQSQQPFNFARWVNERSDQLLAEGLSPEAFDDAYRIKTYKEWQKLVNEEAPVIPTFFRYGIYAVNKRVQQWDLTPGALNLNEVALLSSK